MPPLRQENSWVNLETSLRVSIKIGGHFVSGHVDGIGCLQKVIQTANSWEITFTPGDSLPATDPLRGIPGSIFGNNKLLPILCLKAALPLTELA